jgi:hypothetical protein
VSTWTRLFDSMITDPRYSALSSGAFRVLIYMTAWCNTQLTDGAFDPEAVAMACSMLDDDERMAAIDELEQAGFVAEDDDGYVILAYTDEQQTASDIERKRKQGRARSKRHYAKQSVRHRGGEASNASDNALPTAPEIETETDAETNADSHLPEASHNALEDEEPCESCIESEIEGRRRASASTIRNLSAWKKTLRSDPDVISAVAESCVLHRLKTQHADCDRCRGSAFSNDKECPGPLTASELTDQRTAAEYALRVSADKAERTLALLKATADKHGAAADPTTGICHRCNERAADSTVHLTGEEAAALASIERAPSYEPNSVRKVSKNWKAI